MTDFENLICKRIAEENDKDLHMGCLVVHSIELHPSFDYGWGIDENGNVSHHITIEDVGLTSYAHVFGVACDGGKGPLYATIAL